MTHESILEQGAGVVLWLQDFSPYLDTPFRLITFLGDESFFLLLLPLVYWCLDRSTGVRLTLLFLFSAYVNASLKVLFALPRPFQVDSRIRPLVGAGGGGLPSGHTQMAVVVWGYLARWIRKPWAWLGAAALMILIPLSRLYLGVHFPADLLAGYAVGGILLLLFIGLERPVGRWLGMRGTTTKAALAVLFPLFLLIPDFGRDRYALTASATLLGMGLGFVLERRWVGFDVGVGLRRRILLFVPGVIVLFGLWIGLKTAFSGLEPAPLYRFLRYGALGLWGALGAPWVFTRLHRPPHRRDGPSKPSKK